MTEPLKLYETRVKPEWIDDYDHMNVAHYITVCDEANWEFWRLVNDGRGLDGRDGHEYIIVENHVVYINELPLDTPIHVTTQLTAYDDKRYILFHHLWRSEDGVLSATNEVKGLGFNLTERRIETFSTGVMTNLERIYADHQNLPTPEQAGQGIVLKKR